MPGEDFHLSDHVRFRAHECGSLLPLYRREAGFAHEGASKLAHSKKPTG